MIDNLEKAKSHKNEARTNVALAANLDDDSLFEEALEELDLARQCLFDEVELLKQEESRQSTVHENRLQLVGFELADCYGISGGVYRKMNRIGEAIDMYNEGYKYEADPRYKIQNSYNLVNGIVLTVLSGTKSVEEMREKIKKAIDIVKNQIESTRYRDWWAWADLGILRLLYSECDLAIEAYGEIKELGPGEANIASMISVLLPLQQQLQDHNSEIASCIAQSVDFLKQR